MKKKPVTIKHFYRIANCSLNELVFVEDHCMSTVRDMLRERAKEMIDCGNFTGAMSICDMLKWDVEK